MPDIVEQPDRRLNYVILSALGYLIKHDESVDDFYGMDIEVLRDRMGKAINFLTRMKEHMLDKPAKD
jgi:hypothetical protein